MEVLNICIRGEYYKIDSHGCFFGGPNNVIAGCKDGHEWKFLGVSYHHWRKGIDRNFNEIIKNPKLAINGLLWDLDHGTIRQWGGQYYGHLPRITKAWIE